ncbi:MAG: DUF1624 domain-containing protein [Corallococcus sp.]|nr:DUF1624 domain-containing protein [Corallococcus sp.]
MKITEENQFESNLEEQTASESQQTQCKQIDAETVGDSAVISLAPKRIWEVDFLRGLMILFVVMDHFFWDVISFKNYYNSAFFKWLLSIAESYRSSITVFGKLEKVTHVAFITMFVLLSGVSSSFSRSNVKRGIKMTIFAIAFSAVTFAVSTIVNNSRVLIVFNVIHVLAFSCLIWSGIEFIGTKLKKNWQKNIYGVSCAVLLLISLIVGYYFDKYPADDLGIFAFLIKSTNAAQFSPGDYLAFFPYFGWFLLGAFFGKKLYKEKSTLFPTVNEKWVAPFTFCGRHSLVIYFGSQIVMYGFIYLLGVVGGVL